MNMFVLHKKKPLERMKWYILLRLLLSLSIRLISFPIDKKTNTYTCLWWCNGRM